MGLSVIILCITMIMLVFMLLVLSNLLAASADHSPKWAHEEANALLDFKAAAIREFSEHSLASWKANISADDVLPCGGPSEEQSFTARPSKWEGVYCGDAEYVYSNITIDYYQMHVVGINLSGHLLSGFISPSIGRLRFLSFLHLSKNSFSSIPPEIGQCDRLTSLDLSLNFGSLDVPIPVQLTNCSRLIRLDLSWSLSESSTTNNVNSAMIPSGLFHALSRLQYLNLSSCSSTTLLPAANELGNLSHALTHLDLSSSMLFEGPLPDSIWDLPNLVHLNLAGIRGNISAGISSFPKVFKFCSTIRHISAPRIFLDGQDFPASLGNCTSLELVDFSETRLSGIIPAKMWQLPNLSVLRLGTPYMSVFMAIVGKSGLLSGSQLPKEFKFCSTFTIKELSLPRINLHGQEFPASLVNCTSLEVLDLWETGLTGTIPPEIWQMRANLSTLALGGSNGSTRLQMPGIPAVNLVSFCPTIASLIIMGTDFKGDRIVSPSLGSCSALNYIILTGNRLTNSSPREAAGKSNNNSIPGEIGSLPFLHHLNLSSNGLSGPIPEELGNIRSDLGILDLSNNHLSGQLPASLQNLSNLQLLNLHRNELAGAIPLEVWSQQISVIDLSHNLLSGFANASAADRLLHRDPGLQILSLSFNKLRGDIPEWIWELPLLGMLDLSNNMLSGNLPNHMAKLKCMMSTDCVFGFHFDEPVGSFSDYIPMVWKSQEVPMPENVRENRIMLDISCNELEGEIPSSFGHLVGIKSLNLSHNKFTAAIPHQLGNLSALEVLDVSANELTGGIPVELAYLNALAIINVSYNRLEGSIPTQNHFDTRHASDASYFIGNPGLCGAPLPNCANYSSVPAPSQQQEDTTEGFLSRISNYVALGGVFLGFVLGFLGVMCIILFRSSVLNVIFLATRKLSRLCN